MINGTVCCNVHSPGDAPPVVSPVGFVQDDDLVSSFGQCDFLLSKHLDLVPHHIDSSADTTVGSDSPIHVCTNNSNLR